ncbi:MAG: DUF2452 domain-containing protein [Polyangiaceae bacterium]|nr:DUF2452 domain-containing protein [Polyangiaceae bacterium]
MFEPKSPSAPASEPAGAGRGAIEPEGRSTTYPLSRLAPRIELVDVAREIQEADRMLGSVVSGQLEVIAEQIRNLQARARGILERAELASQLHRAQCNFKKRPGHVYHLYRRAAGDAYLSMLSPNEWAGAPPHAYEGSYRLELDMSWTRMDG